MLVSTMYIIIIEKSFLVKSFLVCSMMFVLFYSNDSDIFRFILWLLKPPLTILKLSIESVKM